MKIDNAVAVLTDPQLGPLRIVRINVAGPCSGVAITHLARQRLAEEAPWWARGNMEQMPHTPELTAYTLMNLS